MSERLIQRWCVDPGQNEFRGLASEAVTDPLKVSAGLGAVWLVDQLVFKGSVVGDVAGVSALIAGTITVLTGGVKFIRDRFDVSHTLSNDREVLYPPVLVPKEKGNEVDG